MIALTSEESVVSNLLRIIKANELSLPSNRRELLDAYQACLQMKQPDCFWVRDREQSFLESLRRPLSLGVRARFIELFRGEKSILDDLDQTAVISMGDGNLERRIVQLEAAYKHLEQVSRPHADLLELCIEQVFIDDSDVATGGTTSHAVGVIWSNPHRKFEAWDLAEFLVHELTHNLMFLDEWTYPHYDYDIMHDDDTWCYSAILKKKRPIDKVVHSVIVAAEIILLRQGEFGEPENPKAHPPTNSLRAALRVSLDSLHELQLRKHVLADRAVYLLDLVEEKVMASSKVL